MPRDVQLSAGAGYGLGRHAVWCPEYRRPVPGGRAGARLRELTDAKAAGHGWRIAACEIMPGHGHPFIRTGPQDSPAHVANQATGYTSRVLRAEFPHLRSRLPTLWPEPHFAATAGAVSAAAVRRPIATRYGRPWRTERGR